MNIFTLVMAITDYAVMDKHEISGAFFKGVDGFHSMHFIDGDNVWHGPQVVNLLWDTIKYQKDDVIRSDASYNEPKVNWIEQFLTHSILDERHWVSSGLSHYFSKENNEVFLDHRRRYAIARANYEYYRHNFVAQRPFNKQGVDAWEFADKQPQCIAANESVKSIIYDLNEYALKLADLLYSRIRKRRKHVYCFEFQTGKPLSECESIWRYVENYRLVV